MVGTWGSALILVGALCVIAWAFLDARRRQRRQDKGWTRAHTLIVAAMVLTAASAASQALTFT
ncbi:hypothetical protein [Kineococcus terrestris]|uniref:hypothetical protein n=1 Tax=Kineococcus terrestris TaxID=2044856 RepID=UPI0034DACE22